MDLARLETLEAQVVHLVEAYARLKDENRRLVQHVQQLQEALHTHQQEVARLLPEHEELSRLRHVMQTFQQERDVIRQKLEQMLVTIEWLESRGQSNGAPR